MCKCLSFFFKTIVRAYGIYHIEYSESLSIFKWNEKWQIPRIGLLLVSNVCDVNSIRNFILEGNVFAGENHTKVRTVTYVKILCGAELFKRPSYLCVCVCKGNEGEIMGPKKPPKHTHTENRKPGRGAARAKFKLENVKKCFDVN